MKAYIDAAGKIRLFRPDRNMERLNNSARRIQLPVRTSERSIDRVAHTNRSHVPSLRRWLLPLSRVGVGAVGV